MNSPHNIFINNAWILSLHGQLFVLGGQFHHHDKGITSFQMLALLACTLLIKYKVLST